MAGKGKGFRIFAVIVMTILALTCALPFILLIVSSITDEATITLYGYSFFPRKVNFSAYKYLFTAGKRILRAYKNTFVLAAVGTVCNLTMTLFVAYMLSKKDLPGRNVISFYIFFTMLFSGGMIPSYIIWSQVFHVRDTFFGLLCPGLLMSAWNIIMMRTYFTTNVPSEILEAAEMDSCSQIGMLWHICIPLAKPMISTISLFAALAYWNDWTNALYYVVRKTELYTIQSVLNTMQNNIQFLKDNENASALNSFAGNIPSLGLRMGIAVVSIIPILCVYPFFQKAFVKGIIVGGVKG